MGIHAFETTRWYSKDKIRETIYSDYELQNAASDSDLEDVLPLRVERQRSRQRSFIPLTAYTIICLWFNFTYSAALRPTSTPAEMNELLPELGLLIVVSVLIFSIQFWLGLYLNYRLSICASVQFLNLVIWYMIDSGNTLESHGSYNLLIFCLILIPLNAFVALLYTWYKAAAIGRDEKSRPRRFWTQFVTVLVLGSVTFMLAAKSKQRALQYGFYNRKIPCSKEQSQLGQCNTCQWEDTVPWFDLLPFRQNIFTGPMTCPRETSFSAKFESNKLVVSGCDNQRTMVRSYIDDSVIQISNGPIYTLLPRTETWGLGLKNDSLDMPYSGFQESVLRFVQNNTFPYANDVEIDSQYDSVLVHCGKLMPQMAYRIQPSSDKVETKETVLPEDALNVVILFIDAMSRNHFHRRLPQTRHVLEGLGSGPDSTSELIEFFRYHSVGMNTSPNTRALWAGMEEHNHTYSKAPIWEQFEEAGYVSARVDPMCQDWSAYYDPGHFPGASTIKPRISHEHIAFSCLPPQLPIGKDSSGNFEGPASIKARCFSNTHVGWHILDWVDEFAQTYRATSPYHVTAAFMEAHEGSGEVLRTLDERLAAFLDPVTSVLDLNKTAVAIVSDHGALMGLNNVFFENGRVESKNPFGALLLPRWYIEKRGSQERLRAASGRLITAFDLYETFRGFMGSEHLHSGSRDYRGIDLLGHHLDDRSCEMAGIDPETCRCH